MKDILQDFVAMDLSSIKQQYCSFLIYFFNCEAQQQQHY